MRHKANCECGKKEEEKIPKHQRTKQGHSVAYITRYKSEEIAPPSINSLSPCNAKVIMEKGNVTFNHFLLQHGTRTVVYRFNGNSI